MWDIIAIRNEHDISCPFYGRVISRDGIQGLSIVIFSVFCQFFSYILASLEAQSLQLVASSALKGAKICPKTGFYPQNWVKISPFSGLQRRIIAIGFEPMAGQLIEMNYGQILHAVHKMIIIYSATKYRQIHHKYLVAITPRHSQLASDFLDTH